MRQDLRSHAANPPILCQRLAPIQNSLIDLMSLLDPDCIYFPQESRSKTDI